MNTHPRATLGPAGRQALVAAIEGGMSLKAAAAAFNVSPATAHRWWHRSRSVALADRATVAWWCDRSSRPHRSPRRLTAAEEQPILKARRETNLGPGRLAGIVRRARSKVWKVLHRHGLSRRRRSERQRFRSYEWSRPGALLQEETLLHMDVKRLARFDVPGHRVTGQRRDKERNRGVGYDHLHVIVDDHSRLAYVELHRREDADTNARTLERAMRWLSELGLGPPEAVMTDGAKVYTRSRRFRELLERTGARHIVTPPYTPRWNGKAERFIQTLQNEWGHTPSYRTATDRAPALSSFLRYYNRFRPHSSLGDRPPISRAHNVHGQDS